ncbi:1,6-anhydro-N-acetylmuramyl-L-alanine amidase AmpD [Limnobacter sp.]|uniref:1,6-anhydro-N-acetylmuramyl-L-alanine amidase AmpD n=1 Tax=Limnobacter sp. TaxID=2003368 RepID=UPI003511DEEF
MKLDEGWIEYDWVNRMQSPNQDARPLGAVVDTVVIHCISLPERGRSMALVQDLFLNRLDFHAHPELVELMDLRVSAHFAIDRDGSITQFVSCEKRAWHAGLSAAMDRQNFNHFSVGIELLGDVYTPFDASQYASLHKLIAELKQRYPLRYALGHSEIAPTRKTDPGPFFDWKSLRKSYTYDLL